MAALEFERNCQLLESTMWKGWQSSGRTRERSAVLYATDPGGSTSISWVCLPCGSNMGDPVTPLKELVDGVQANGEHETCLEIKSDRYNRPFS